MIDDDLCVWVLPARTLIWAEATHQGMKHQVPFRLMEDAKIGGHPNMLRKAGAIQPKPAQVTQAGSGEKPQQAVMPSPMEASKRRDGQYLFPGLWTPGAPTIQELADPFNCPTCGAHDYGLYAGKFGECVWCLKRERNALKAKLAE